MDAALHSLVQQVGAGTPYSLAPSLFLVRGSVFICLGTGTLMPPNKDVASALVYLELGIWLFLWKRTLGNVYTPLVSCLGRQAGGHGAGVVAPRGYGSGCSA